MSRPREQRIADTVRRLETDEDVWLATASPEGVPHLIPLSLGWDGHRLVMFTFTASVTVRNVAATGRARAALDGTLDVVLIDGAATAKPVSEVPADDVDDFVRRSGWDPRQQRVEFSVVSLKPERIDAFIGEAEVDHKTIMKDGNWIE